MTLVELAEQYHKDQLYGTKPYIYHLKHVVSKTCLIATPEQDWEILYAVAWLHDLFEDTDCPVERVHEVLSSTYNQEQQGRILKNLALITHSADESRGQYIQNCMRDPIAHTVKIADTMCNLEASIASKDSIRIFKYIKQLTTLLGH